MKLGKLREKMESPQLGGAGPLVHMDDDRKVVVQVNMGENEYGTVYEYRELEAVGVLFFRGEFVVALAAGDFAG